MLKVAFWSVGLVIDPPRAVAVPNQEFLATIGSSNPRYTGWPVWLDARTLVEAESRPRVINGAFEYLIISPSPPFSNSHFDFARLDPKGEFFLHRLLQDDGLPNNVRPGSALDPSLMVLRVAEALGVGLAFARALGWPTEGTTLAFAFRWHKLRGRQLTNWATPFFDVLGGGTAHDDEIESCVQLSLDTPLAALTPFVHDATKGLFAAFDGTTVPSRTLEDLIRRLFERRLAF
jgi:hypothetical protein